MPEITHSITNEIQCRSLFLIIKSQGKSRHLMDIYSAGPSVTKRATHLLDLSYKHINISTSKLNYKSQVGLLFLPINSACHFDFGTLWHENKIRQTSQFKLMLKIHMLPDRKAIKMDCVTFVHSRSKNIMKQIMIMTYVIKWILPPL